MAAVGFGVATGDGGLKDETAALDNGAEPSTASLPAAREHAVPATAMRMDNATGIKRVRTSSSHCSDEDAAVSVTLRRGSTEPEHHI